MTLVNIQTGDTDPGWSFSRESTRLVSSPSIWDGYATQTLAPVATTPSMGEEVVPDFAGVGLLSDITYRRRREKLEMELGGPLFDELLQPA